MHRQKEREVLGAGVNEAKQRLVARELELKEYHKKLVLSEDAQRKQSVEWEQSAAARDRHTQQLQEQVLALERVRSKELEELNARLKQAYQMHEVRCSTHTHN